MNSERDNKKSFTEKLRDTYRLVILNNDTFQEISSYRLSLMNIYIILSSFVVVLSLILMLFIVFTPIKKLIPGYGDASQSTELIELNKQLDQLIKEKEAQDVYISSFRKMLTVDEEDGEVEISAEQELLAAVNQASNVDKEEKNSPTSKAENSSKAVLENTFDFIAPISGSVSAAFMPDKKHNGIDILAPANTAVKAVMDGYVIISGWNIETGNTVGVQHADNIVTFYKHNSALLKEEGNFVKAGEALAIIGNSGTLSDGPHLHFELWIDGNPVNPENYLKF